jgi:serine/threonine-protein kinase
VALPPAIDDVIRKGTSKDPSQRYANCAELINAARVALAGVAQGSAPAQLGPQSGSFPAQAPMSGPMPVQQGQYQAGGYQQPLSDPVRLRPPNQVGVSAFTAGKKERPAWFAPVIAAAVAIVVIIIVVVILSPGDEPARQPKTSSAPSLNIGDETTSNKPLPTSVPVRTSR